MNVFDMATEALQKAIKTVVDATKDGIDIKQDQLASSIDGMNTKIVKMVSPFEPGKFVTFQILGNKGSEVVYSVTGSVPNLTL